MLPTSVPTEILVLSSMAIYVNEPSVRRDLEAFGKVRGFKMDRAEKNVKGWFVMEFSGE